MNPFNNPRKALYGLATLLIVSTLPVSGAYCALPEMPVLRADQAASPFPQTGLRQFFQVDWKAFHPVEITPGGLAVHLVQWLRQIDEELPGPVANPESLEEAFEETPANAAHAEKRFWTRKTVWITVSLLALTGILVALVGLLASSGGGSGSGGGEGSSGGSGTGGDTPSLNQPPAGGGGPAGGGSGGSGGGITPSGSGAFFQTGSGENVPLENIPHNPEPSTLLLAGLGLLVPLIRRRS